MGEVIAGAAVLYPAQTITGSRVLHLARTEARRGREPALIGVCPRLEGVELDRARRPAWWRLRRVRWCPDCEAYARYLRRRPST